MNTKNLVTFKTILEMGSFQKAADKLGYTQSTVTFQIKQLEEELALKLFEKIGRRMELTQAGKDIMPYVDMISPDWIELIISCTLGASWVNARINGCIL